MDTEVWGIARVKDEADVIGPVVEHMLDQADRVLVADNTSTDGTRDTLADIARRDKRLTVLDDPEVGYFQSRQMSALAAEAWRRGAGWVVPFDADEWWHTTGGDRIADALRELPDHFSVAEASLFDHVATGVDPADPNPITRMQYRRPDRGALPKVACKPMAPVTIHQGNHGADHGATHTGALIIRHFPYRTVDQFVSKVRNGAAAYAATDLPEHQGQHWRDYGKLLDTGGPAAIADVFRGWFWAADPHAAGLVHDPAPL